MKFERLTTAEQQGIVLQNLRGLEAQHISRSCDLEVNKAAGNSEAVKAIELQLQQFESGIAAIKARYKVLLAFKPKADDSENGSKGKK